MRDVDFVRASAPARSGSRSVYFAALGWLVWLLYIVPVIASLLAAHPAPLRLIASLCGAALFVAFYVWTAWQGARRVVGVAPPTSSQPRLRLWLPILAMLALSLILTRANGVTWGALFIYTCAAAAGRLTVRDAAALVGGVAALTVLYGWRLHLPVSETVGNLLTIGFASVTTMALVSSVTSSRQRREEREELARYAAVAEERLRIARDLHDLLGQNLSLIALKSELAGRLLATAPERAVAEIGDVERVARTELHEVREAVAGYRQPTLASEMRGARDVLAAAGIAYRAEGGGVEAGMLPTPTEAVMAWTVREGITNAVRHSGARQCDVRVTRANGEARVEVTDDGSGMVSGDALQSPLAPTTARPGNGLRGLAERVAALGGRFEAGPRVDGGFRLAVAIPITRDQETDQALRSEGAGLTPPIAPPTPAPASASASASAPGYPGGRAAEEVQP